MRFLHYLLIVALTTLLTSFVTVGLADQPPQVVDIGQRMLILTPDGQPTASVILIPGGSAHPEIMQDGSIGSLAKNFLMAAREQFVAAGLAVGIIEQPEDLRAAIARMRSVRRPVFAIGHSDGTMFATNAAVSLGGDGPDGIVLASSVIVTPPSMPRNVLDYPLEQIAIPVLLVRNENDGCRYSPPSGMDTIAKRLVKAHVSTVTVSSTESDGNPCQNRVPHSYYGIETETIAKIVAWINARIAGVK